MSLVERRRFLNAAGAFLALAVARGARARAAQGQKTYRVAALLPESAFSEGGKQYFLALRETLAAHGFVDGRNLQLDTRAAATRSDARFHAEYLLRNKPDALFTLSTEVTLGAQDVTTSVPIVFSWVADPKISGIVKDYARPGGNATGVTNRAIEVMTKRLEIVKELLPQARHVVVTAGVGSALTDSILRAVEPAAEKLQLKIRLSEGLGVSNYTQAIREAADAKVDAAIIMGSLLAYGLSEQTREMMKEAEQRRMPVIYFTSEEVEFGGLISYGTNPTEDVRRGARYLARVLKGANPRNLAVDQASRFELVLNLKAAKTIGLAIPPSILLRADRVIE